MHVGLRPRLLDSPTKEACGGRILSKGPMARGVISSPALDNELVAETIVGAATTNRVSQRRIVGWARPRDRRPTEYESRRSNDALPWPRGLSRQCHMTIRVAIEPERVSLTAAQFWVLDWRGS
jgi:hypothetical protein